MASKSGKIAILGFGREGKSVLKFLKKSPQFRGAAIKVLDKKFGRGYLKNLERFKVVFRSPGIPYNLPELKRARKSGVEFLSATKLFFDYCPTKNIIGITGTKGKGTTSTLLYKILKAALRRRSGRAGVYLAGNIGKSPLEILPKLKSNSWVILELSSFQLQDLEKSPHFAAILDVFPDHQDSHLSLREYYEAKANIARHQKTGDKIFYFKNSLKSAAIARKSRGRKIAISEADWKLFRPEEIKIPGHHNFKNAVMAASMALSLDVSKKIVLQTVKNFRGLEHRLEFVRTISVNPENRRKQHSHILKNVRMLFYNDSASTNPHTTAAAIKAFPDQPKILIAGGQDKGLDYVPLARALHNSNTKWVILCGENKRKIKRQIAKSKSQIVLTSTLKAAVKVAYRSAKRLITNYQLPITVLFSPGSASFDQFKNYADRGQRFKKVVRRLGQK